MFHYFSLSNEYKDLINFKKSLGKSPYKILGTFVNHHHHQNI